MSFGAGDGADVASEEAYEVACRKFGLFCKNLRIKMN